MTSKQLEKKKKNIKYNSREQKFPSGNLAINIQKRPE